MVAEFLPVQAGPTILDDFLVDHDDTARLIQLPEEVLDFFLLIFDISNLWHQGLNSGPVPIKFY